MQKNIPFDYYIIIYCIISQSQLPRAPRDPTVQTSKLDTLKSFKKCLKEKQQTFIHICKAATMKCF